MFEGGEEQSDIAFLEEAMRRKSEIDVTKALAKHIAGVWSVNQENFKATRSEMVAILRRASGQYGANKLADIQAFKGSEIFVRSSETKCRAAESWIKDLYSAGGSVPWDVEPTASPDLPDNTKEEIRLETEQQALQFEQDMIAQGLEIDPEAVADLLQGFYEERLDDAKAEANKDAKERCKRAATVIKDQNQEGGWSGAFKDFLYYFVRMKFAVIKGPTLVRKKKQEWEPTADGRYALVANDVLVNDVYCVSPFNIYPSKDSQTVNNGDIIEIHELSRQGIADLIGVPSYSEKEIKAVLDEYDSGKLKAKWFTIEDETAVKQITKQKDINSTRSTTDSASINPPSTILAQEFYGSVSGRMLLEWGSMDELDPHSQYQVNCWKIGSHVIKAVVNPDALNRKPYHFSSWAKNPSSLVGEGLMEFAAPIEDAMNAIMRALINNIAIASGPMAEVDKDRVDMTMPIYPWRQIESTAMQMKNNGPAVNYYQPQMHAQELINSWQFLSKVLDEMTVPAYAQGASQSGVTAGTATVFTQLLAAASRAIKAVAANIDDDIITPYVQMCYDNNMRFTEDETIKGDARIVAKGVSGLAAKEQQAQRKVEYLQAASNPTFQEILGSKNIASILAQIAKSNDIELPDMDRLDGTVGIEERITQMLMSQSGVDPMQANGQVAQGGGAVASPQAMNPDGSQAGVANVQ